MADKARTQTDKKLRQMERDIGRVYRLHPALLAVEKEYAKYMGMVQEKTKAEYRAYMDEDDPDIKAEKEKAYMRKVRELTMESTQYNKIVKKIVGVLAEVNQQALDISNKAMPEIYAMNYNQVAEDCKKVGIKVNGEE